MEQWSKEAHGRYATDWACVPSVFRRSPHWLATGFGSLRYWQWNAASVVFRLPRALPSGSLIHFGFAAMTTKTYKALQFPIYLFISCFFFFWRKIAVEPPVLERKLKFVYFAWASPITTAVCNFWLDFAKHTERDGDTRPPAPSRETGRRRRTWRVQRRKRRQLQLLLQRRDKPSPLDESEDHSGCSQAAALMFLHDRNWDRVLVLQRMLVAACLLARLLLHYSIHSSQGQKMVMWPWKAARARVYIYIFFVSLRARSTFADLLSSWKALIEKKQTTRLNWWPVSQHIFLSLWQISLVKILNN